MTSNHSLSVICWNALGIRSKSIEFFSFLSRNKIDIGLVSETWLSNNATLSNSEYNCYRVDRVDRTGGGVAIVVRKTLKHTLLPVINTKYIENIGVDVHFANNRKISFFSVYFPGRSRNSLRGEHFKSDILKMININGPYLIGGDFNCRHRKWGCVRANTWGNILENINATHGIEIMFPNSPTYYPSDRRKSPSTIDFYLTNTSTLFSQPIVCNDLSSDHLPVKCGVLESPSTNTRIFYDLGKANWSRYRNQIKNRLRHSDKNLDTIESTEQIDSCINVFNTTISESINLSVPKKSPSDQKKKLPQHILNTIKLRNRLRRQWQRNRIPRLNIEVKLLNNTIKTEIFMFRNSEWNLKLQSLDKNSRPFWNIAKALKKKNSFVPAFQNNHNICITNTDKANALANTFYDNHSVFNRVGSPQFENTVQNSITNFNSLILDVPDNFYVGMDDLIPIIRKLQIRKSVGFDGTKNIFLKELPRSGFEYLVFIFNCCIKFQYFPICWKVAKVVPVLKPGKQSNDPKSYRPISLLSCTSKVFERLIKFKLNDFIYDNNIYPPQQFGFREQHSTVQQVNRITKHVRSNFNFQKSTGLVLLDVEKAFDSVWHNGLIYKMITFNFPLYLIKIVQSFLTDRYFAVYVSGDLSQKLCVPAGVPQGSVLGPLLYNIYTADFPQLPNCESAIYADDTAIFSSDVLSFCIETNLQSALNILDSYYTKWKIQINASKTQAIFFSRKRKSCFLPSNNLMLNNTNIIWGTSVKYLGIHLDKRLTFNEHVQKTILKVNKTIKILYPLINRKSLLNNDNKLIIFKVIFQSIMLYGSPVWGQCAKTHIKKLQIAQNKVLKLMLKLPWHFSTSELHNLTDVDYVSDRILKLKENYDIRCQISDNVLITSLINS